MTEEHKTLRRDRRAAGKIGVDDRGNSVWDWNPRTLAHSLDDTNALLEQLDDDTLALVDTQGIETTSRLQALRDEFDIYQSAAPEDDGSGLYPREHLPRRVEPVSDAVDTSLSGCSIETDNDDVVDDGSDPYNHGACRSR